MQGEVRELPGVGRQERAQEMERQVQELRVLPHSQAGEVRQQDSRMCNPWATPSWPLQPRLCPRTARRRRRAPSRSDPHARMRVPSWQMLAARLLVPTSPPSRIARGGAGVEWEGDRTIATATAALPTATARRLRRR
eukprot:4466178-Pyramimonas_sp.AAC.1